MANRLIATLRDTRDALSIWGVGIVVLGIGLVVALQFVGPAPPRTVVMLTGAEGGAYRAFGEQFAERLRRDGIEVELRESAGSVENLSMLANDSTVDVGFVQGGLATAAPEDRVVALGSLYFEPLWLFIRSGVTVEDLSDLAGLRVAGGDAGSGTRAVTERLLDLNELDGAVNLVDLPPASVSEGFDNGAIDAALLIGAPDSDTIRRLIDNDNAQLVSLARADAYVRYSPHISKVLLPRGVLDLRRDLPASDLTTVAVTAMLAAREDLHPAVVDLLLIAATDIFGNHSLLANAGQFPTERYIDLPMSEEAERYFDSGPPFLMRYLPFWAATLVQRLWVIALPFVGLAIPLVKLLPPMYRWRIRRRLLSRYARLDAIDPYGNPLRDDADRQKRLTMLSELDHESAADIVPRSYMDDVYKLRRDIDLVRKRLSRPEPAPENAAGGALAD